MVVVVAACIVCATLVAPALAVAKAPSPAPLVVIDAGHGGRYSNANANGLKEKHVVLAIAKELRRELLARGYRVKMTRTTDRAVVYGNIRTWNYSSRTGTWTFASDGRRGLVGGIPKDDLQGRVNIANTAGADLFISIHANGARSRTARGTETWYSRRDKLGSSAAAYVNRAVVSSTKLKNRKTHSADFYVCRWSNMPGILVETAFISNRSDARLLKKSWFRRRIAAGIASGVDTWMNKRPYTAKYPRTTAATADALAATVSKADFAPGVPAVVVVREDRVADTPGVAGLARKLGAPLLLAGAKGPSAATAAELARLAPGKLVIAGVGESFDASAVASLATASNLPTSAVDVVTGTDRARVSASIAASMGPAANGEVLIASAGDIYSSLPAAPLSALRGMPLLLSNGSQLAPEAQSWLAANRSSIRRVVLVGSASALPGSVAGTIPYTRIDGASYTQKSARLNARYVPTGKARSMRPVASTLLKHGEYLVASGRAARRGQPVIPVSNRMLPAFTREWISNRRVAIGGFEIVTCGSIPYLMDHMLAKAEYL